MKRVTKAFSLFICFYVLIYVVLSSFGAYAPASYGTNGIKWYAWAPLGFYSPPTGKWMHTPLRIFYAPLSVIDERYWHTHGRFPGDSDPTYPAVSSASNRR